MPPGSARAALLVALLAPTGGCSGERTSNGTTALRLSARSLTAYPVALPRPISPENDEYGFAQAVDLRVHDGRLLVLENQNSRVVRFDSSFVATGSVGRDGAGPGELRGVIHLDAWDDEYAVSEINNARISVFGADGSFRRTLGVPDGGAEFAFAWNGELLVNAGSPDHYLYRVDREGLRRPFGARVTELYPAELAAERAPRGMGRERVAVLRSDVYVFDVLLAGIVRFDSLGARRGLYVLPGRVREGLLEATRRLVGDFGGAGQPVYTVSVTDLTATDDGRLLLLFPVVDRTFGLLIDPSTGEAEALEWPSGSDEATRGLGGGVGVVQGGWLYRALSDEVTVFRLDPAR